MNPQRVILGAWLAMIGLATARSFGAGQGAPQPGTFLAGGVLFTLYLGAASIPGLGPLVAVFAVGTDLAAVALPYLRTAISGQSTGPGVLDTAASWLEKISDPPKAAQPGP